MPVLRPRSVRAGGEDADDEDRSEGTRPPERRRRGAPSSGAARRLHVSRDDGALVEAGAEHGFVGVDGADGDRPLSNPPPRSARTNVALPS